MMGRFWSGGKYFEVKLGNIAHPMWVGGWDIRNPVTCYTDSSGFLMVDILEGVGWM